MGFPSPAQDYVESRIDLNTLFIPRPSATSLFDFDGIMHLIDASERPRDGDVLAYELFGEVGIGKLMGRAIVTRDGDAIEGGALDDVIILGRVTLMIQKLWDDDRPII
ncbi:S24/S26 family peptidase [Erwinia oleae]|uniref:hypothetical protein n=1 Tax=Erwinia oleae TaxID=796334 RepID=UPI0005561E14|nr:hypothetical protein [Erwinia oleae]